MRKVRWAAAAAISAVLAIVLLVQGNAWATRSYFDEASAQAGTPLRLAVSALAGHLGRYEPLPALIAAHDEIRDLIAEPDDAALRQRANLHLKETNALLESSDIYVMTLDGETIAASNYDGPASFVGQNFSYRPYFFEAAEGHRSRFYALGTTSLKRGYYFSSPVKDNGVIAGVIVFKVDIEGIEATWGSGEYRIMVSDPEGIIFMSGNPEWLYNTLLPLTPERIERTTRSRRYADAVLKPLPFIEGSVGTHRTMTINTDGAEREYLVLSQDMKDAGWTVSVLMDTGSVRAQALTSVIAAFLCLCLAGVVTAAVLQRRVRLEERMALQMQARNELESRVAARTADLARLNTHLEREITERRATERQLRRTQADLIQAGKLAGLGQMSAALSHEFNQPLAAVRTYAESATMLIERGRAEEASDNLQRITGLIDRMASISRHLRNFARKPNEKPSPVALDEVVRDTMEIVTARLKAADAHLDIDLGSEPLAVMAGPVRLQQVLVNILSNAADAVEGREDRRIRLQARTQGERVRIAVSDHGPGVPRAIAERIFDPFFTTKGVGRGLGLGLSISYNIVKDFGGSLSVGTSEHGGAEFVIELARADKNAEVAL